MQDFRDLVYIYFNFNMYLHFLHSYTAPFNKKYPELSGMQEDVPGGGGERVSNSV